MKGRKLSKREQAIEILRQLGVPLAQQNERSALTLLALLDLNEETPWSEAKQNSLRIHDIMEFIKTCYGKVYAENTRETIRRQTIHQFEQAGIVVKNPDNPARPTNSPRTCYKVTDEAFEAIKRFGTPQWEEYREKFIREKGKLIEKYEKIRTEHQLPIEIEGTTLSFSPGEHNELQIKVIQDLRRRFFSKAELVYIGDTARKKLFAKEELLKELGIPFTDHDKLPDVVFYERGKNILFLIEVVTSHGPMSPKRQMELEEFLKNCQAKKVYFSVFQSLKEFKQYVSDIAWETEVWIADKPDHLIHFNGPKFIYVHTEESPPASP